MEHCEIDFKRSDVFACGSSLTRRKLCHFANTYNFYLIYVYALKG